MTRSLVQNVQVIQSDSLTKFNIIYSQSVSDDPDLNASASKKVSKLECDAVICASGSSRLVDLDLLDFNYLIYSLNMYRSMLKVLGAIGHNILEPLPSLFSFKVNVRSFALKIMEFPIKTIFLGRICTEFGWNLR